MDGVAMRGGGTQQQAESASPFIPTQSWYPQSVLGPSTSSSRASLPPSSSGGTPNPLSRNSASSHDLRPHSPSSQSQRPLPTVTQVIPALKDKSAEEIRSLLMDKELYNAFLHSLDQVRQYDTLRDDLKKSNVDLARHNLGKEAEIAELRNQCMIIRNTQLAAAREKFEEVEKREKEVNARCSPAALLDRLQEMITDADDESERIHQQLLQDEINVAEFISKYRKQRMLYHRRSLIRLAALTSFTPAG